MQFSVDDLTLLLLGLYPGDILDKYVRKYVRKLEGYFYEQFAKLAKRGINVVMDLGLWSKLESANAK